MSKRALGLVVAVLALWIGSASAAPLPFFYLVPTGPTTVPTVVPVGTSAYQLWVDPSGITVSPPCNPCIGVFGVLVTVSSSGSLTMTGFNLTQLGGDSFTLVSPMELTLLAGDQTNGNSTPFETGTLTISNSGTGPGDVTLSSGTYLDDNLNTLNATTPQVLAIPVPEPGTLLLLGAGLGGLAAAVRTRRTRVL